MKKEFGQALASITQLGLSVAISFLLWIFIAYKVKTHFNLGNYCMVLGVILGCGSAIMTFVNFCRKFNGNSKKKEK